MSSHRDRTGAWAALAKPWRGSEAYCQNPQQCAPVGFPAPAIYIASTQPADVPPSIRLAGAKDGQQGTVLHCRFEGYAKTLALWEKYRRVPYSIGGGQRRVPDRCNLRR